MTIGQWITQATAALLSSATARLDALVLLGDELHQDKAWLLAHTDDTLTAATIARLHPLLKRRAAGEPLAYIRGKQEFFGRTFMVGPATLIPRPESETGIELLLELPHTAHEKLLDVGTGSGILAITAKLELPELTVSASDISPTALQIARLNAKRLSAAITLNRRNLLTALNTATYDIIIANLPYVDQSWQRSLETNFEPHAALFAADEGLELIKQLIVQGTRHLSAHGKLLLEADPRQHLAIMTFAVQTGYRLLMQRDFWLMFEH